MTRVTSVPADYAFLLAWPTDQISQTLPAKSPRRPFLQTPSREFFVAGIRQIASGKFATTPISQKVSAKSVTDEISESLFRNSIDLSALTRALEGLPNKVLTAECQTVLPDQKLLAEELDKTRRELEARRIRRNGQLGSET